MSLNRCTDCGRYTLEGTCPACGASTHDPSPAKFSPEDKYGEYRRRLKLEQRMQQRGDA